MKRFLYNVLNYALMAVLAFALVACESGNEGGNDNTPEQPEQPEQPEAPEIIANNGVGEDGKIALTEMLCAYYLGDVWNTGVADYRSEEHTSELQSL